MSDDKEVVSGQEEEKAPEVKEEKPLFEAHDPRKSIYEMSDAIRFPKVEESAEEETSTEEKEDEPVEGAKAQEEAVEAEVIEGEIPKEELTPREKRKLENLEAKEKRLTAWEQKLVAQFNAAEKPPEVKTALETATTPFRHMSEDQVQARYDELALESPYRANRFLRQVEDAKAAAAQETEAQRIETDFRDFRSAYPDITESDWVRMNDPKFYEKYPDILRSMERGQHFATFVAARGRLVEEKLIAEKEAATKKGTERDAEVQKRIDAKKRGTVVRMSTKVENLKPKEETPKSKEEQDREFIRRRAQEQRARMGMGPPKP